MSKLEQEKGEFELITMVALCIQSKGHQLNFEHDEKNKFSFYLARISHMNHGTISQMNTFQWNGLQKQFFLNRL